MATVFYPSFDCVLIDADGVRTPAASETIDVYNVTAASSLGTVSSDSNGIVAGGSFTAAVGDIVEFSHATYPLTFRARLSETPALAFTENNILAYVMENLATLNPSDTAELFAADIDNPDVEPVLIGSGRSGTTAEIIYPSNVAKNLRIFARSQNDREIAKTHFDTSSYADIAIPGLAFVSGIGDSVASGTAKSVLYLGASNVLAQDNSNFAYDYTNQRLGLGTNAPTERLTLNKSGNVTTINNALGIRNTTPTNGGNGNEYSPALEFESHGRLESAAADKTGKVRLFLKTPYVPSGTVITSHLLWQMDRGSIASYNNLFEMISPAPQEPTASNAFRFYRLDGASGLDFVVGSNNTAAFYAATTTNLVPVLGSAFGSHESYQAFYVGDYHSPKICAVGNGIITLQAGRGSDGANVGGSEKVSCLIPMEIAGTLQVYTANSPQIAVGYSSTQKWTAATDSAGTTTLNSVGTTPKFVFSDAVELESGKYLTVSGARFIGYTAASAAPSLTPIPNNKDFAIYVDEDTDQVYLIYNFEGALRKVQLT